MSAAAAVHGEDRRTFETDIPFRLDRLPWSRWHWMIVIGLGTVWILDGLEVTIVGSIAGRLTEEGSGIHLSDSQIGQAATLYVLGACFGALFFARLTDKFGRKKLFMITLGVYLTATVLTAFSNSFLFFGIMRFFTGAGIGGEYAAINSAIDELIPARVRGRVDLMINGSFWFGAAGGGALSLLFLNEQVFPADTGWRWAFGLGAILGLVILLVRRTVPESPRWLIMQGRVDEAEEIVTGVEKRVKAEHGELPEIPDKKLKVRERGTISFVDVSKTMFGRYRRRATVGFALFIGQAFLYNAIFFTYALVLKTFYDVPEANVGYYIIPFALGNLMGPLVLGRLFDTVGRKPMIAGSYIASGVLLLITAYLFKQGVLTATTQTICWCVIFFFASAGASAAYLTVSEIFPMETRAMAIAFFFAIGTGIGGAVGPVLFANLVETEKETPVFWGYVLGAGLMIAAGLVQAAIGVKAERRSLEDVALPVSAEDVEEGGAKPETNGRGEKTGRFKRPSEYADKLPSARRRFGPSQSDSMYAPRQVVATPTATDTTVDSEVDQLVAVLSARGELTRREMAALADSHAWGPGRFSRALELGVLSGKIRRSGRDRFSVGGGAT